MKKLTKKVQEAKKRVCLALDVPTVKKALNLAKELSDYVGTFKVGKELHTAACREGIPIVNKIYKSGGSVFLDLKLHDTPETMFGASVQCSERGVYVFNIHVEAEESAKKALEGSYHGAEIFKIERPKVIGVTVLTSLKDKHLEIQKLGINYDDLVRRRTELAREWGLDGVVCPANKAGNLEKEFGSDFIYVTPGIKWAGVQNFGQSQVYTPDKAVKDCSNSILVIGSAITKAGNIYEGGKLTKKGTPKERKNAAYEILQVMAKNL